MYRGGIVAQPKEFKEVEGGNFLRFRVKLDLSLPLCRGRLISLENGKQIQVSFKYERLPNLSYWCGRLTHDDKDCEIWIDSEGTLKSPVAAHNVREFNIRLNEIDAELAKFDNTKESKTTSRALSFEQSNDNLSDSRNPKTRPAQRIWGSQAKALNGVFSTNKSLNFISIVFH